MNCAIEERRSPFKLLRVRLHAEVAESIRSLLSQEFAFGFTNGME